MSPFGLEVTQDICCKPFWVREEVHFVIGACHAVHLLLLRICSYVNGGRYLNLLRRRRDRTKQHSQPTDRPRRRRYSVKIWIGLKWLRNETGGSSGSVFPVCQL